MRYLVPNIPVFGDVEFDVFSFLTVDPMDFE